MANGSEKFIVPLPSGEQFPDIDSYDGSVPLTHQKHELFANNLAMGMTKMDAHERAGFTRSSSNAHQLARTTLVQKRTMWLIARNKEKSLAEHGENLEKGSSILDGADPQDHGFTHMWVLEQLKYNVDLARRMGEFVASNAALKLIGEHIGMFGGTKKIPNGSNGNGNLPLPSTAEAISALVSTINQGTGGSSGASDGALRDLAAASVPITDVVDEKSKPGHAASSVDGNGEVDQS